MTIFGGTGGRGGTGGIGRTDRHVVDEALAAGHSVQVSARSSDKLAIENANLTVIQWRLGDTAAIARAVAGSNVVISTLGSTTNTPVLEISEAVAAVQRSGLEWVCSAGLCSPATPPRAPCARASWARISAPA